MPRCSSWSGVARRRDDELARGIIGGLARRRHRQLTRNGGRRGHLGTVSRDTVVERVTGIEPAWPAWKAGALPLSYTREVSAQPNGLVRGSVREASGSGRYGPDRDRHHVADATAQAELVRRGEVSPEELVEAAIDRIEARQPAAQRGHPPASTAARTRPR